MRQLKHIFKNKITIYTIISIILVVLSTIIFISSVPSANNDFYEEPVDMYYYEDEAIRNYYINYEEDETIFQDINKMKKALNKALKTVKDISVKQKEEASKLNKYKDIPLSNELKSFILKRCKDLDLDPGVVFSIYYLESRFNIKCTNKASTARGIGQILKGTAKTMYEMEFGNKKNYNHDMAFDPIINIKLTTRLMYYLRNQYGKDYRTMCRHYSGQKSDKYYNLMMKTKIQKGW